METIGRITSVQPVRRVVAQAAPTIVEEAASTNASPSTGLVPIRPSERPSLQPHHPSAAFLAHLIAARAQVPQARARRRSEPGDAVAAYQNVAAACTATSGLRCALHA